MIIEKLKVKNYKSLEDVEIPLHPLTVFVGPNNSGKSNIFDCLELVKELAFLGPQAVTRRGGFGYIVWGGDLKRAIDIELNGQIEDGNGRQRSFKYELGLTGGPMAYSISKELFSWSIEDFEEQLLLGGKFQKAIQEGRPVEWPKGPPEQKLLERAGDFQVRTWSEQEFERETGVWGLGEARLGISQLRGSQDPQHRTLGSFSSAVADWGFYKLVPARMSTATPARKEALLSGEGENLSTIMLSMQSENLEAFNELVSYLKTAVPEIEQLMVGLTEDGRAYVRLRERGLPVEFRVPLWSISDGTLYLLALLALRFAPRLPPLLCMEEPENFIHAGLLELVADLLRSISKKTQLLVNTHSPYLVDHLSPDDLLIVEKTDGRTHVRGVSVSEGVKEAIKVLGLGELWYSGAIGGTP